MNSVNTGAHFLAESLHAYGVTHVFFVDAILRKSLVEMEARGITRVLAHSEKAAAYMADGFARISRRPGICMAQSVGAANLAAGLQDAFLGSSPVVAITGRHAAVNQYRNAYQELPHQPLFASVTKFHANVEMAEQLPRLLRQAFREATSGTPRPVHLDVAGHTGNVLESAPCEMSAVADPIHRSVPPQRPGPDQELIRAAAAALAAAARPVIIADRGAAISGAGEAIVELAEKVGAVVLATFDAKGIVPENHRLYCGTVGTYGRDCANRLAADADLVLFVGSHTSDMATGHWRIPRRDAKVIQIDVDPAELGRNFAATIGIHADPAAAVAALTLTVAPAERSNWIDTARQHVVDWRSGIAAPLCSPQVPLRPERVVAELQKVLPANAILVSDTGYSAQWTGALLDLAPDQTYMRAAGTLGWSFPASLGAKCAAPDRPVVCFTGDGGFFYHFPELETARRRDIKTITIVNNNQCLAQGARTIDLAYAGRSGNKDDLYKFRDTDFAKIAHAMDCFGVTVEEPEQFATAFAAAQASALPAVIDVKTEFAGQAPLPWIPEA